MEKTKEFLKKTPNALLCVLGAVVFLMFFYFLSYRTALWDIWLPCSMNNDEVVYNREVTSVITHGGPQGYFGYNENTADIGRYSTWGPFLIWAYAIPAFFFGSGVNMLLWCNLLLITLGIAYFARSARLNLWQCVVLCGVLMGVLLPLQSSVSGAAEAMQYLMAFVIVGSAAAVRRTGKTGWLVIGAAACALETIFRPYALLFWVFPLTAVWQHKKRRCVCLAAAAASFVLSIFSMTKMAAAYFGGGMDFAGVQLLLQGHPITAVRYEGERAVRLLAAAWQYDIVPTLQGNATYIGGGILTFIVMTMVVVLCLLWDKRKGGPLALKASALFCAVLVFIVLLTMYRIETRHLNLLIVLLVGAVVAEDTVPAVVYMPALLVMLFPMNFNRSSLSEINTEMAAQMEEIESALTANVVEAGTNPWDNTLAYSYGDDVFHGYLYAVPDGMGIEFDKNSYLWDAENPIYSRYVMCGHGTRVEERLLSETWQELVSTEDLVIYKRS